MIESITTMNDVSLDLTEGAQYERLVAEEIHHYSDIEVTENLTEGGLHSSPAWQFNYTVLWNEIIHTNVYDEVVKCEQTAVTIRRVLSIGCGYGGHELAIARRFHKPFEMTAVDLNPSLFEEAQHRAHSEGLSITFKALDLNSS